MLATWYDEVVIDRLYDGKTQLPSALQALVTEAAQVLELDVAKRQRTLIRVDGHGGSLDDVNWLLDGGYQLHTKAYSPKQGQKLAQTVMTWYEDPQVPGRQFGLVTQPADEYVDRVHRIAVRTRKKNGQWGLGILLSTLSPEEVTYLVGLMAPESLSHQEILAAYVYFYDLRGGGVETAIKSDKQAIQSAMLYAVYSSVIKLTLFWAKLRYLEYFGEAYRLSLAKYVVTTVHFHTNVLTYVGKELLSLCDAKPDEEYKDLSIKGWTRMGINVERVESVEEEK